MEEYPIDGYTLTDIRRLDRLDKINKGIIDGPKLKAGQLKMLYDIKLNLLGANGSTITTSLPSVDPELQSSLNKLFPNLDESYSIAILDITPGRAPRFAARQVDRGFQPGSVGKLAIATAFFAEIAKLYPECFDERQYLMRRRFVRAGTWALTDEHTVPFYDPEQNILVKRQVQAKDVFSLYEWIDHMMSVSNNGAASIVWRETVLMRVFGDKYPDLTETAAEEYWKTTPKAELSAISVGVINEALANVGITDQEWRLGTFFTRGATAYVPPKGGSIASPAALMKWMIQLEKGGIVDEESSLEIKRLMYMTDRRIRYAANSRLDKAAVYFKSGSLYGCQPEEGFQCAKYQGNTKNFMNSVAIVEHPNGVTYMVALMSNVLRKNSNTDHNSLAGKIDVLLNNI